MHWQNDQWLWALWTLPVVVFLLVLRHRRCVRAALSFADAEMAARIMPDLRPARAVLKGALLVAGLTLAILALARPRWGVYYEELTGRGVDIFVVLDVSRSMLAEDVARNRLERAKADVIDLLGAIKGDRVGLILFAGKAVVKCPLTLDYGFFQLVLKEARPGEVPAGGTLIGDALRKASRCFSRDRSRQRLVVLITDGEDHESFPLKAAAALAEDGIKVVAIGLGNPDEGARVPLKHGGGDYLTYEGQVVWSKLDEATLREIAIKTDGAYIPARTRNYDLGKVYRDHIASLEADEATGRKRKRFRDRFQWFLWPSLLLLLLDASLAFYPRRRAGRTS
jgi:Ca-activated chloride channel family protein